MAIPGPEGGFTAEVLIEHVAHALKMDPIAVKEINMTREGDLLHFGDTTVKGCSLRECWDEVKLLLLLCASFSRAHFSEQKILVRDYGEF